MFRHCWLVVVAAFSCGSAGAQTLPAAQTPDEVGAVLRAWHWEGDWFQDCQHKDLGGHYMASLGQTGFPTAAMFYNGTQTSEGRLTSARIGSDGSLVTVTESRVEDYLTSQVTAVQVSRDDSFQVLSLEADVEAIDDVPKHSFYLTPEGMARGTRFHAWVVRSWMVLDRSENPLKPTAIYHRCDQGVS